MTTSYCNTVWKHVLNTQQRRRHNCSSGLQRTATYVCNILHRQQHECKDMTARHDCNIRWQRMITNTPQHQQHIFWSSEYDELTEIFVCWAGPQHAVAPVTRLHHTATRRCNMLQHMTAAYCNTWIRHAGTHGFVIVQHMTAAYCNTSLQHTSKSPTWLQHTVHDCIEANQTHLKKKLFHAQGPSHVTQVDKLCDIQEWVMSHSGMSHVTLRIESYGVATISTLLKIIGLFCKRAL